MKPFVFSPLLALLLGCGGATESSSPDVADEWKSAFHPVAARVTPPWRRLEATSDKPDRLLAAFVRSSDGEAAIDSANGHLYIVKVSEDVPQDVVSDDDLIAANKEEQLATGRSEFIDDARVTFHGDEYRRLRFRTAGKRRDMCQHMYFRRTGEWSVSVQIAFPYDEKLVEASEMSPTLTEFDRGVTLFDAAPEG